MSAIGCRPRSSLMASRLLALGQLEQVKVGRPPRLRLPHQGIAVAAAIMLSSAALAPLLGFIARKPSQTVDFMIATEGEMKKVNWSTRREILGSTWVVIAVTMLHRRHPLRRGLLLLELLPLDRRAPGRSDLRRAPATRPSMPNLRRCSEMRRQGRRTIER